MAMSLIWLGMILASGFFALLTGRTSQVGAAAMEGAAAALTLCLRIGGPVCLWSGAMELMRQTGLSSGLSKLLQPFLCRLFPTAREDGELLEELSHNFSANLLGLGNAATPAGIRAARLLRRHGGRGQASDELCRLVVMNTASLQLIPTTVAALRASLGAERAFDILPAVWLSSLISLGVGLGFSFLWGHQGR